MTLPEPKSRKEQYLATAAGMTGIELPEPASREEQYLDAIAQGGGGGGGGYTLPVASASTLGGVKVGENLSIDAAGILSATGGGGGGAVVELTSADYDYPEENPTSVDISALPEGLYHTSTTINVHLDTGVEEFYPGTFVIKLGSAGTTKFIKSDPYDDRLFYYPDGYSNRIVIDTSMIVNNLTTNASQKALSAAQGKVLNEKIAKDLTNVPDDTTVSGTTGLKIWDMPAGHYFINGTDRNIFWTVSVTDVLEGVQGTFDIVRFTYNNYEYATIKFFGSMGEADFMEAWVTVLLSNGTRQGLTHMVTTETF